MKVVKEINTTIPTVSYGNISLLTRIEYDSTVDEMTVAGEISRVGGLLDKAVCKEWRDLHDFVETHLQGRIAGIKHEKAKKR